MKAIQKNRAVQNGSALIVALVFMLLLTIVGVGAMQSVTLQERMAGNTRDMNTAFQSAEASLRAAEGVLGGAVVGPSNGANGLYKYCEVGTSGPACSPDWRNRYSAGWATRGGTAMGQVSAQPQYIVEELNPIDDPNSGLDSDVEKEKIQFYRVIARGFGVSDNTMVVIETRWRR